MRKASLGTLFLTVFLDLLGFGLVVPFLPGVARDHGASDFVATLVSASFSAMQFLFIPLWGRLSDRIGRRPVLLWSIAASILGMTLLGLARSLTLLFVARIWSGIATANIAVAQAYIADVTTPETRAKGMGIIGMGFGLGFIIGPFVGGELGRFEVLGQEGTLACFVAAGLSVVNLVLALTTLPESLPPDRRARQEQGPTRRRIFDLAALRVVAARPGMRVALVISFFSIFWFAGMEVTFRLFTADGFGMTVVQTGRVFAFVGVVSVVVQGGLIHRLSRRFGEVKLIRAGVASLAIGFGLTGHSPDIGVWLLFVGSAFIAAGTGLNTPSLSSYSSRQASADTQGFTLGVMQSMAALARVAGPVAGGISYELLGMRAPYYLGTVGLALVLLVSWRLPPLSSYQPARATRTTSM
jgi:DHA1 family tetracycline resistance protein-like MFS transporter